MTDRKRTISGPGAADFLTSTGGEDRPESSPSKGMGSTRDEADLTNPRNLVPDLGPDNEAEPGERPTAAKPDRRTELTGSQTGTVGGGGPDAHNPDAGLGGSK